VPAMMAEQVRSWPFAGRRRLVDTLCERGTSVANLGQTMIRHVSLSSTVAAISFGMHGTATRSCLIASPGFPLPVAAPFLRAGSDAVDLASIAPPTDKNLGAAARAQEHPARCFIRARGTACASCRKPKLDQVLQDLVLQRCGPFSSPDLADVLQLPQRPQSAARASACGYVDNARALPTYPQAQQQQPTSIR
jgi:hypothetical protein